MTPCELCSAGPDDDCDDDCPSRSAVASATGLIAWIDIETTGLDPANGIVLEVGAVITDLNYSVVAEHHSIVKPAHTVGWVTKIMDPVVADMHAVSGLMDRILAGDGVPIDEADRDLCDLIERQPGPVALGGAGVTHMEARWLPVHMPRTYDALHYWTYDVSVLRRSFERWGYSFGKRTDVEHRALEDARQAAAEFAAMRRVIAHTVPTYADLRLHK